MSVKEREYKMKSILKKLTVALCIISASVVTVTSSVLATDGFRNGPSDTAAVTQTDNTQPEKDSKKDATSVTDQATAGNIPAKKYLTKWGGFFWFLLSVAVNFVLSCWVANRFYNLARRNAQGSAEIRALRKDIEEKFASTLKDIDEPVTEVVNHNESYAREDAGIEMPERKSAVEIKDEEREILGRWDMKRVAQKEAATEDDQHPVDIERRAYAPTRSMSGIEFEDDDRQDDVAPRPAGQLRSKMDAVAKAGTKAKDFLSNIFPFDE